MNLFGKKQPSMKEQVRTWTNELKKESRAVNREVLKLQREEQKVKLEIKKLAKNGTANQKALRTLARGLVRSKKTGDRLLESQARVVQKSTDIMKSMSTLIKIPQITENCKAMAKEMMKAGIIEDMVEDTMSQLDDADIEEQADSEIDKIVLEVTKQSLSDIGKINNTNTNENKEEEEEQVEEDAATKELQQRMAKLSS